MNLGPIPSATSSPGSADGPSPFNLQDGQATDPFGPEAAPANPLVSPGKDSAKRMNGISGPSFIGSSRSAGLQSSLESRLRARTRCDGSMEYSLTWKERTTPAGRRICALRASAHPTQDRGFSGLPTPSGTSNRGKNHVAGRLDEWGGSSNPFRGTELGRVHCPSFELWMMGFPAAWLPPTVRETLSCLKSPRASSKQQKKQGA